MFQFETNLGKKNAGLMTESKKNFHFHLGSLPAYFPNLLKKRREEN